ncbi:MAG: hypothetical protein MJ067_04135 [Oscillospiraceae bacterium]|nr:hypothetical protein [Oscillospiraceae bacterium]
MQRNQKICKLIEELSLYILENHSSSINIDIREEDKKDVITFTTDILSDKTESFLRENIVPKRLCEVEEYAWELMGEGASDDDFKIVSALINEVSFENSDNKTIIRLVRYE